MITDLAAISVVLSHLFSKSLLRQVEEWKNIAGNLSAELESKMDRLEFGPLRDELEDRLQALASQLSTMQRVGDVDQTPTEDEAAGIRKQLLQPFNCISCDKPVHLTSHKYVPNIYRVSLLQSTLCPKKTSPTFSTVT